MNPKQRAKLIATKIIPQATLRWPDAESGGAWYSNGHWLLRVRKGWLPEGEETGPAKRIGTKEWEPADGVDMEKMLRRVLATVVQPKPLVRVHWKGTPLMLVLESETTTGSGSKQKTVHEWIAPIEDALGEVLVSHDYWTLFVDGMGFAIHRSTHSNKEGNALVIVEPPWSGTYTMMGSESKAGEPQGATLADMEGMLMPRSKPEAK